MSGAWWVDTLVAVRYVSLAYGTKAELEETFRNGANGTRSERRQEQAQRALAELAAGETAIKYGETIYMIEESAPTDSDHESASPVTEG